MVYLSRPLQDPTICQVYLQGCMQVLNPSAHLLLAGCWCRCPLYATH
jgi:hypothetical protein